MSDDKTAIHEKWMKEALELARAALARGQFPVGCVLVGDGEIVGRGSRHNSSGTSCNELDHAEILALRDWVERGRPGSGRITAYSTLEPCLMCTGALLINGIERVVFAYEDVMGGACGMALGPLSHAGKEADELSMYRNLSVTAGILRHESLELFKAFFRSSESDYLKDTALAHYTLKTS